MHISLGGRLLYAAIVHGTCRCTGRHVTWEFEISHSSCQPTSGDRGSGPIFKPSNLRPFGQKGKAMSNTIDNTATTGAQEPAAATPDSIIEQLRGIRQQIPEYTQLAIPDAKAIRRVAHINADFIDAAINAVGASEIMQTAVGRTNVHLRDENEDAGRWTAVEDELRAMLKGVVAANLVRRHRVGLAALQTYNISRQLIRQKEHADLLPHYQGMKRLSKFGRRRKTVPLPPETQPQPTPQQ